MNEVTGLWYGEYLYDDAGLQPPGGGGVTFELKLRWRRFGRLVGLFAGTVVDDPVRGMPGLGLIAGSVLGSRIRFIKRMPEEYVATPEGPRSFRERLAAGGHQIARPIPHVPVVYRGILALDEAAGTWRIAPSRRHVPGVGTFFGDEVTGTWRLWRSR